jgi:hypothetical protein
VGGISISAPGRTSKESLGKMTIDLPFVSCNEEPAAEIVGTLLCGWFAECSSPTAMEMVSKDCIVLKDSRGRLFGFNPNSDGATMTKIDTNFEKVFLLLLHCFSSYHC